jgi:hypothetical protein
LIFVSAKQRFEMMECVVLTVRGSTPLKGMHTTSDFAPALKKAFTAAMAGVALVTLFVTCHAILSI